jgi:hypothetical protein
MKAKRIISNSMPMLKKSIHSNKAIVPDIPDICNKIANKKYFSLKRASAQSRQLLTHKYLF